MKVISVEFIGETGETVYDLTVENTHNYLVSESDVVVHNSGVGRSYDDGMMVVDFKNLPIVVPVCDMTHADVQSGEVQALERRNAEHLYAGKTIYLFEVPDSREGWAKAVEKMELMAFHEVYRNSVLLIDFSKVRPRGSPIAGMQDRPASGPGPLIAAIRNVATLREAGMAPWRAAMYADHYLAECVLVGGARRAARMSTKFWKDKNVLDFVQVKRGGFLWSSNNSVTVDAEFWKYVNMESKDVQLTRYDQFFESHAKRVFNAICEAAYYDGTGEPGIINVDRLSWNEDDVNLLADGDFAESRRYKLETDTLHLMRALYNSWRGCDYQTITNPCVPYETPILTDKGYVAIGETVDQEVNVWNGYEFSKVTPFATGFNPTVKVKLSDGSELRCTPTHKFVLTNKSCDSEGDRVEARDLKPGDKLAKYNMPVVMGGERYGTDRESYSQGFYSGDGNTDSTYSWLYSTKYCCECRLLGTFSKEHNSVARKTWNHGTLRDKAWVPVDGNLEYCLNWLAGLLDSDGTVCTDTEGGQSFQISSINKEFLLKVRLMLSRLGVQSKVVKDSDSGMKSFSDDKGGTIEYFCQTCYCIIICGFDCWTLKNLGLVTSRVQYNPAKAPNRSARRFVQVVDVIEDEPCETFCFTEPKNHTGTFNGTVTGQCGEIVLGSIGGYCVIADVVPFHAKDDNDAEDAFRTATRALIRTNTMNALYGKEVKRTNRIGVGITGFHEWAWDRFGFGWKDIVNEEKSKKMWLTLSRFKRAVQEEAVYYSTQLGMTAPHTNTTIKPAGTTSKLFGLTEGAHLPSMREYLRWVQFRNDDPLIDEYVAKGYPVKKLQTYSGTTIVGFPTQPLICSLGMGDKLVTAAEATPEEQYEYLRLMEKYWIVGVDRDGITPLEDRGNQVSYTLKYDPKVLTFEDFKRTLREGQATIRCCSVMPQTDTSAYEYIPEQMITKHEFETILAGIKEFDGVKEDVDLAHVDCSTGACPIDFNK